MTVDSRLLRVERLVRDNPARHRDGCTPKFHKKKKLAELLHSCVALN